MVDAIQDSLINLDTSLLLMVNGVHNDFFNHFMYTYSGKFVWIPMYAGIFYLLFKSLTARQLIFVVLGVVLLITLTDQLCAHLIRPFVERWRPSNTNSPVYEMVHVVNNYRGGRYGFPSCHASNTFALATYVTLLIRCRWLTVFMMLWALITCYSRTYLGVHYPGDLLAGGALGAMCASLVYWLLVRFGGYSRPAEIKYPYLPIWMGLLTIGGIFIYSAIKIA